MAYLVTHRLTVGNIKGSDTVFELLRDVSTQPTIAQLPIINTAQTIRHEFDRDGVSPLNSSYTLTALNNDPDDLYELLNEAEPQSIMLRITAGSTKVFQGFAEPESLDQYYDSIGEQDLVTVDFYNGLTSLAQTNITNVFIEELLELVNTDHETLINYDRLFSAVALKAEGHSSEVEYAWPWIADNWRQFSGSIPSYSMMVDLYFRFQMYREFDREKQIYTEAGKTLGQIFVDICRTFGVRIGYSYTRQRWCVYDFTSARTGTAFNASIIRTGGNNNSLGFSPRTANTSGAQVQLQALTEDNLLYSPRSKNRSLEIFSSVTHDAPKYREFLRPDAGIAPSFTIDNLQSRNYLTRAYQYGPIPFEGDGDPEAPGTDALVQVIDAAPPNISSTSLAFISHPVVEEELGVSLPVHAVISWLWSSWRFVRRRRFTGVFDQLIDPMIPVSWDGSTWLVQSAGVDPISMQTSVELLEISARTQSAAYLRSDPSGLDFGLVAAFSQNIKSYNLTGQLLNSDINVTAPPGFTVSLNAAGPYAPALTIPVSGGNLDRTVFVKFSPTETKVYVANIINSAQSGVRSTVRVSGSNAEAVLRLPTQPGIVSTLYINPVQTQIFKENDFITVVNLASAQPYQFRIIQDQQPGDDFLLIDPKYVPEALFAGSIITVTDQILTSFISRTNLAVAIGVRTNAIGNVLEQLDDEVVTEIYVQSAVRLVEGNDYDIATIDRISQEPTFYRIRPTQSFEGVGNVQIQEQRITCNIGDSIIIPGTTLQAYTEWRPDRIISTVQTEREGTSMGLLLTERLTSSSYTTLPLRRIPETFNVKNGQKIYIYYMPRGGADGGRNIGEAITVNGDQTITPSGVNRTGTITIQSWTPQNDYLVEDPETLDIIDVFILERSLDQSSRITLQTNRIDIVVQDIDELSDDLAFITLEVGQIQVDLSDLDDIVSTIDGEVGTLQSQVGTIGARAVMGVKSGDTVVTFNLLAGTELGLAVLSADLFILRTSDSSTLFDDDGITLFQKVSAPGTVETSVRRMIKWKDNSNPAYESAIVSYASTDQPGKAVDITGFDENQYIRFTLRRKLSGTSSPQDLDFAIAAAAGQFLSNTAAGDAVIRPEKRLWISSKTDARTIIQGNTGFGAITDPQQPVDARGNIRIRQVSPGSGFIDIRYGSTGTGNTVTIPDFTGTFILTAGDAVIGGTKEFNGTLIVPTDTSNANRALNRGAGDGRYGQLAVANTWQDKQSFNNHIEFTGFGGGINFLTDDSGSNLLYINLRPEIGGASEDKTVTIRNITGELITAGNVSQDIAGTKWFTGILRANQYRSSDNSVGQDWSVRLIDSDSNQYDVVFKNGILTSVTAY